MEFKSFPFPARVRRIVCCDLDETYRPIDASTRLRGGVAELETFITERSESLGLILGWVTGSSLKSVMRKAVGYSSSLPHFISPSLGSEFYWVRDGRPEPSAKWQERIERSGFSRDNILSSVSALAGRDVSLTLQHSDFQGEFMGCYYYFTGENPASDLAAIAAQADKAGIKALVSKCNPAAGDPADAYDVHFLPRCCGKGEALDFLCGELGIEGADTWAFGDSCNDMDMLHGAGNAFLVANADPQACELFPHITSGEYCHGIREKLEKII